MRLGCEDTSGLISAGDGYVGATVSAIMASKVWKQGRNAIVITNKVNHYPITDNTPYNHYSLLRSIEDAFRLPCLANACDTAAGVRPMTPLFHP
jgi:hypothetical protein